MADFTLTAASPLAGYDQTLGGIRLRNVTDLALVSIALPLAGGGESAVKHAFGLALPPVGKSQMTQDGATRLARLGRDQLMALFAHASPDAEPLIAAKLNGLGRTPAVAAHDRLVPAQLMGLLDDQGNFIIVLRRKNKLRTGVDDVGQLGAEVGVLGGKALIGHHRSGTV